MKTNIRKMGAALVAIGVCICCAEMRAQTTTTTVTTTRGAFTQFMPDSETVVLRSETSTAPLRYIVTKTTTVVDETGAPVAIQNISPGVPLSVDYTPTGDRLVASRIVVHRTGAVGTAVTSGPVTTEQRDTTTTTTRPLTHDEKEALKEQKEDQKERMEKEIERKKEALEKAKDKLDDEH
jgi:hypothetical protein